jgi:hypothetical protein
MIVCYSSGYFRILPYGHAIAIQLSKICLLKNRAFQDANTDCFREMSPKTRPWTNMNMNNSIVTPKAIGGFRLNSHSTP